ncbi:unnamed protein product, partial [Linum tenue]
EGEERPLDCRRRRQARRLHHQQGPHQLEVAPQAGGSQPLRQELPPPLDQLPPPRHQARQVLRGRGEAHHQPPLRPRQQMVENSDAPVREDGQRDQELLQHAHQEEAAPDGDRPADPQIAQIINLTQLIGAAQQLNSIMMLNNNGIIGNSNNNNNNNNSVANSIIPLLHLLNPATTSAASTFLAQQQQQQQIMSSQEELLLARLLNPAGAGAVQQQELFCNQFLNTLPALATGRGSSLMVNNNNNGALATARESALPGLVSAEASPEASSSTSLVHHNNNVNGGVDGVMEAGNNNNNYPHLSNNSSNFSDGTTAFSSPGTAADVDDNQYEAWEKMLLMDDDFVPTFGDSGFFSSWKDDDLVLE